MSTATLPVEFQDLPDGPGALTQADDGKVPVWSWDDRRLIMLPFPQATERPTQIIVRGGGGGGEGGGVSDHALLTNLDYASSGHTGFEAEGAAAAAIAAHLLAADPHAQYLLASGTRAGASSQAQTFTSGVVTGKFIAPTDGTNGMGFYKANGTTQFGYVDSLNGRLGINKATPTVALDVVNGFAVTSPSFPPLLAERTTTATNSVASGMAFRVTTSNDMADGFGSQMLFSIQDNAGVDNQVAAVRFLRDGADNQSSLHFLAGALSTKLTIRATGYTGVGQTAPTAWLHLPASTTAAASLRIPHGTAATSPNDGDLWTTTSGLFYQVDGATVTPLVSSGAVTGATSQRQSFTNGIAAPSARAVTDSATGFQVQSTGGTVIANFNTSAGAFAVNTADATLSGTEPFSRFTVVATDNTAVVNAMCVNAGTGQTGIVIRRYGGTAARWYMYIPASSEDFRIYNSSSGDALTLQKSGAAFMAVDDAVTSSNTDVLTLRHTSTGTPGAGFGAGLAAQLESSTTINRDAGRLDWVWDVATDASRASKGQLTSYYTSTERPAITWGANSTVALLSFYDVTTPIARQVLATGAGRTVDDVITALQALGLVKQS